MSSKQRFLITRRKVGERFAKMCRKQWFQIRNDDSPLLILFLDVSSRNSANGLAKEVFGSSGSAKAKHAAVKALRRDCRKFFCFLK